MNARIIDLVKDMAARDEMDQATDFAKHIINEVDKIITEVGISPAPVYFMLWVGLCRALADAGWTADELVKDLRWHVEDQMKDEAGT